LAVLVTGFSPFFRRSFLMSSMSFGSLIS
jgi:hypothetical protein